MKTWTPVLLLYVIKIKLKKCKHMHFVLLKATSQFPNCALNALHVRLLRSPLMGQSVHFISVIDNIIICSNCFFDAKVHTLECHENKQMGQ